MTAATVLEALGDPTRRTVFEMVAARERSVAEIAAQLPVSRPAVSQHLRVLREARLVRVRPDGVRRLYVADPRGVATAQRYFEHFWTAALASFSATADAAAKTKRESS